MTASAQIDWITDLPGADKWVYSSDRAAVMSRCREVYDAITEGANYRGMVSAAKLCKLAGLPRTDLEQLLARMEDCGLMLYEDGGWFGRFGIRKD